MSIEKQEDGKLSDYIRIRSKSQGITLSLCDKISSKREAVDVVNISVIGFHRPGIDFSYICHSGSSLMHAS